MSGLSERERRLIALAILAGLVGLTWVTLVSPIWRGFSARREERAAALMQLDRNARLIAAFSALRAQTVASRVVSRTYAFQAASPSAASDLARARVAAAVVQEGGVLQALRNQAAPYQRLRLQAVMRVGLPGLTRLIRRLETDTPYAAIEGLYITAAEAPAREASPALEVRLEVSYGYAAPA